MSIAIVKGRMNIREEWYMGRFALMEFLITLGVLFLIFKVVTWIVRVTKQKTDEVDECLNKQQKKEKK